MDLTKNCMYHCTFIRPISLDHLYLWVPNPGRGNCITGWMMNGITSYVVWKYELWSQCKLQAYFCSGQFWNKLLCHKTSESSKLTPKVLWWFQAQNCLTTPLLKASYSFYFFEFFSWIQTYKLLVNLFKNVLSKNHNDKLH
jgi:hypothetical protein